MTHSRNEVNASSDPAQRRSSRGLPLQNLILGSVIIAGVSGAAHLVNARTGFPFGRCELAPHAQGFGVPLWLPFLWPVVLLSARSTARLLLQRRRGSAWYGYWLLATSAALATFSLAALDLFATHAMHWWQWSSTRWRWEGFALPALAGSFLVGVLALLAAAPALIDKRPVRPRPGLAPLALWAALQGALLLGLISRVSDAALATLLGPLLILTLLAVQRHRDGISNCDAPPPSR